MPSRSSVFHAVMAKLPTPHPVMLLAPIAIGAHMAAPSFAMGDTNTANVPPPIQTAVDAVRSALPGAKSPVVDASSNSGIGVSRLGTATIPSQTVVIPSGGLGSSGMSDAAGGNFGGTISGSSSGGRIPARPAPLAPQANLSPPPRPTSTSPAPVHPLP